MNSPAPAFRGGAIHLYFCAICAAPDATALSGEILTAWNKKFPGLQKTIDELIVAMILKRNAPLFCRCQRN